jgi:hypothetical protein
MYLNTSITGGFIQALEIESKISMQLKLVLFIKSN